MYKMSNKEAIGAEYWMDSLLTKTQLILNIYRDMIVNIPSRYSPVKISR